MSNDSSTPNGVSHVSTRYTHSCVGWVEALRGGGEFRSTPLKRPNRLSDQTDKHSKQSNATKKKQKHKLTTTTHTHNTQHTDRTGVNARRTGIVTIHACDRCQPECSSVITTRIGMIQVETCDLRPARAPSISPPSRSTFLVVVCVCSVVPYWFVLPLA